MKTPRFFKSFCFDWFIYLPICVKCKRTYNIYFWVSQIMLVFQKFMNIFCFFGKTKPWTSRAYFVNLYSNLSILPKKYRASNFSEDLVTHFKESFSKICWSGKILIVPHFYLYVLGYKSTAAIKYSTLIFFHGKPWSYRPSCQQPESTKLHKQILSKTSTYLLLTIKGKMLENIAI